MKPIADIAKEEETILAELRKCVANIQKLISPKFSDLSSGAKLLSVLRSGTAENINQLQHAALAIEAVRFLQRERPATALLDWSWNPYQTGGSNEPDLQAGSDSQIAISAEVTTSEKPDGIIDSRMRDTLQKLQAMSGERFYFVRTDAMEQRAKTKILKNGFNIRAEKIPLI